MKSSFWNIFDRVLTNKPRTTNFVDLWHRSLNKWSEIAHPNLGKLIKILQQIEKFTRFQLIRATSGIVEITNKDSEKDIKLITLIENYQFYNIRDYFNALDFFFCWKEYI
jgi:hypothetical protein